MFTKNEKRKEKENSIVNKILYEHQKKKNIIVVSNILLKSNMFHEVFVVSSVSIASTVDDDGGAGGCRRIAQHCGCL